MKQLIFIFIFLFCRFQWLIGDGESMLGVYWGSFDPPTIAHQKIILAALEEKQVNRVIIFVNQFGKKPYYTDAEERKKMMELMLQEQADKISVMIQSDPDKRIDFANIRQPEHKLALIVGEDSYFKRLALPLEQRGAVDKIFVFPRSDEYLPLIEALETNDQILYVPNIKNISSTTTRKQLMSGDLSEINLHPSVLKHIFDNGLYSTDHDHQPNNQPDAENPQIEQKRFLQQHTSDLAELLKDASQTQSKLSLFLKEFSKQYPDTRLYIPEIKGMRTIQDLLKTRWNGNASMITDYSRATISFPTLKRMYGGLEDLKKAGLIILQINDSFETPCLGGYRDINIVFLDSENGHLGEIQLNLHTIMDFKNGLGTDLFHVIRYLLSIPAIENRPLTGDEQVCLDILFEKERLGYEAALNKATEFFQETDKPEKS